MGISISPSMKVIIGMTTELGGLFMTSHSPISQCWNSTLLRILYCALKVAMLSRVSTSLANPPMEFYGKINVNPCKKKKGKKEGSMNTATSNEKISPREATSTKISKMHK